MDGRYRTEIGVVTVNHKNCHSEIDYHEEAEYAHPVADDSGNARQKLKGHRHDSR